jgi:hypothetical protein
MLFAPQVPYGAKLQGNGLLEENAQDTHARVEFTIPRGSGALTLNYSGGVSVMPILARPEVGESSKELKITRVRLDERTLSIALDHGPAAASVELRTAWKIREARGADVVASAPGIYLLNLKQTTDKVYVSSEVRLTFE